MKSLRNKLKNNRFIYSIYNKMRTAKKKRHEKKELNNFKKNYLETMVNLQNIFTNNDRKFFFAFGTLLGIIRDNKLLDNDMDIDMIAYCVDQNDMKQFKQYLISFGLKVEFEFSVEGIGVVQHAFRYNKIRVDVHYCFASDDSKVDYVYVLFDCLNKQFKVARFACPHSNRSNYNFQGIEISVPSDSIGFIENMYGKDWRTPNSSYKFTDSPCVTVIDNAGYCNI